MKETILYYPDYPNNYNYRVVYLLEVLADGRLLIDDEGTRRTIEKCEAGVHYANPNPSVDLRSDSIYPENRERLLFRPGGE